MSSSVILLRGPQGVGKTVIAEKLAVDHGFMRLSKDDIYNKVMPEIGDHHAASRVAYSSIKSIVQSNRSTGVDFVIDAPVRQLSDVSQWECEVSNWGYFFNSVLLYCGDSVVWNDRLSTRIGETSPSHQITSLVELQDHGSHVVETNPGELAIDTASLSIEDIVLRCVEYAKA